MIPTGRTWLPAAGLSICLCLQGEGASAKDPLKLYVDQARVMRMTSAADTVIIGNPMIADATVRDAKTLILTGRTFGTTNLIVLDGAGQLIAEETLTVESNEPQQVTIYRLGDRRSFSCTPVCEPTLTVGDQPSVFDGRRDQITGRNNLSQGINSGK